MIRIEVFLDSAISPERNRHLGRMEISNVGGTDAVGNYRGRVLRRPAFSFITREGQVINHRRNDETVWHLIAKMLKDMGYVT